MGNTLVQLCHIVNAVLGGREPNTPHPVATRKFRLVMKAKDIADILNRRTKGAEIIIRRAALQSVSY